MAIIYKQKKYTNIKKIPLRTLKQIKKNYWTWIPFNPKTLKRIPEKNFKKELQKRSK